jgi:glycolate oxidase iron-sulfur subunit
MLAEPQPQTHAAALKDTDRCVMCGLCLPHCPTYGETRSEADSPRGRVSLMQALATGRLAADESLIRHLDGCLACRACESVCPSGVPYGRLIDAARVLQRERHPPSRLQRLIEAFADQAVARRGLRNAVMAMSYLAQRLGLIRLLQITRLARPLGLERALSLLPPLPARPYRASAGAGAGTRGRVALFTGCAAEHLDRTTLEATERLLTRLGYAVAVPNTQTCCGALSRHAGREETANALEQRNLSAFDDPGFDAIVSTASGCGAQLVEYDHHCDEPRAVQFAARNFDVSRFLLQSGALEGRELAPLPVRIAVHTPCSLRNVMRSADDVLELLRRIPGAEIVELPGNARCCGSAGAYMLTQPEMADALRQPKLDALEELQADILVTSNIGCALHFKTGMKDGRRGVEVLHPVTLLERQLV